MRPLTGTTAVPEKAVHILMPPFPKLFSRKRSTNNKSQKRIIKENHQQLQVFHSGNQTNNDSYLNRNSMWEKHFIANFNQRNAHVCS